MELSQLSSGVGSAASGLSTVIIFLAKLATSIILFPLRHPWWCIFGFLLCLTVFILYVVFIMEDEPEKETDDTREGI